jgi:hypothetical protein
LRIFTAEASCLKVTMYPDYLEQGRNAEQALKLQRLRTG